MGSAQVFPPGPRPSFPGQNLLAFQRHPLQYLVNATRSYGDIVHLNLGRQATEEFQAGANCLPPGSVVLLSQWVMHRDARYYPLPERFDPERFSQEAIAARPRYAYFPFGGGPRVCVGEPFAWMEGVLLLAILLQRWQMRLASGFRFGLQPSITLRPRYGMPMLLFRRPDAPED